MIPVDKESPYYPHDADATATANARRPESLDVVDGAAASSSASTGAAVVVLSPEEESRKDIDAFLGKIDSTLALTRKYVAKSQNSFE